MGIVTSFFFDGTIRTVDDPKPKKKITLLVSWDMFFWRKGRVGHADLLNMVCGSKHCHHNCNHVLCIQPV